jgi:hypothetical protein
MGSDIYGIKKILKNNKSLHRTIVLIRTNPILHITLFPWIDVVCISHAGVDNIQKFLQSI